MRSLDLPLVGLIQDGGALAIALEAHHPVRAAVAHQVSLFGVTFFIPYGSGFSPGHRSFAPGGAFDWIVCFKRDCERAVALNEAYQHRW
jgi:hypothetical protein